MPEKDQKEFAFMNEQLKKKPFYRQRWFQKGVSAGALAAVFGVTAGVAFSVAQPWAKKQFGKPDDPSQIIVIQEETEQETQARQTENETEAAPQTVIEQKNLEIADYRMLYEKMAKVAEDAVPTIVTVTCETSQLGWFDEVIENHIQASGLVIARSHQEYFILTGAQAVETAERIIVTFSDGTVADAMLRKCDHVTGLAVLRVPKSAVGGKEIMPAELPASKKIEKGEPVIALGTPVANSTSMSFGMITSVVETPMVDSQYRVLNTDILGSEQGSGVLIDLDGRIVGIIVQNLGADEREITLTALEASDIQELVTDLANNRVRSSIGITGKEIDETISDEFDMPRGIYVRNVSEDSPAMYAGVFETDIITGINGEAIMSMDDYEKVVQSHSPDESIRLDIKRATMEGYVDMEVTVQLGSR